MDKQAELLGECNVLLGKIADALGELDKPPPPPPPPQTTGDVPYDRGVLVNVLVYHWRTNTSGCGCGWAELGASHPEHVADVYEESILARQ